MRVRALGSTIHDDPPDLRVPLPDIQSSALTHDVQSWHTVEDTSIAGGRLSATWNAVGMGVAGGGILARVVASDGTEPAEWRRVGPHPAPHSCEVDITLPGDLFEPFQVTTLDAHTSSALAVDGEDDSALHVDPKVAHLEFGFETGGFMFLGVRDAFFYPEKCAQILTAVIAKNVAVYSMGGNVVTTVDFKDDDTEEMLTSRIRVAVQEALGEGEHFRVLT
mmetsp:Transcript_19718/g.52685  ORF Transcript_19718/g.52685 Transcript_19718/m.52685 type:complete len:221 (-) Transcript_19718:63-725(-)